MKTPEEQFEDYKEQFSRRELSNTEAHDRAISILFTSMFGFSFLAISYIGQQDKNISCPSLLAFGWVLLVIMITLYLINFWLSNKGLKINLENVRKYYHGDSDEIPNECFTMRCVRWINRTTTTLFIIALISITLFVTFNLNPTWIPYWMKCLNLCSQVQTQNPCWVLAQH